MRLVSGTANCTRCPEHEGHSPKTQNIGCGYCSDSGRTEGQMGEVAEGSESELES